MDTAMLTDYCSPTILFSAIALVQLFSDLKIPAWKQRALIRLAPLCFSVYIIHENPLIRKLVIRNSMNFALDFPLPVQPLVIIAVSLLIWLVCSGIDSLRLAVFRRLGIEKRPAALQK